MKFLQKSILVCFALFAISCGGPDGNSSDSAEQEAYTPYTEREAPLAKASERVDLTNKGIGPITSLALSEEIDEAMAQQGREVYELMCVACHKADKQFIGPAPKGILERRTPEWVMNMILNPEEMIKEDPLAKDLLTEFNGAPMANQGLTEEQARAILEYFRTIE